MRRKRASVWISASNVRIRARITPLLIAALGFSLLFGGVILARMRTLLAEIQTEARLRRKALA